MRVRKQDYYDQERYYLPLITKSLFIHPTDTHYAIGCDATNSKLCLRLRLIKQWQSRPLPIIAPSKEWIRENMHVPEEAMQQLPGAVTIIARMKNPDCVCSDVHLGSNTLSIRLPQHWIMDVFGKINKPIVSTCANKKAHSIMTSIETADEQLLKASEVIIHEGPKRGKPMVFIDYTGSTIMSH